MPRIISTPSPRRLPRIFFSQARIKPWTDVLISTSAHAVWHVRREGVSDDDRGVFPTPVEGAHPRRVDRQASCARSHPPGGSLDTSALVHTAWDLGSPLNTVVTYFEIVGAEIRAIDSDSDLDLTPVQRVAHMLNKGYLIGSHFLPHDALATQKSGKPFLKRTRWACGTVRLYRELMTSGLARDQLFPGQEIDFWPFGGLGYLKRPTDF